MLLKSCGIAASVILPPTHYLSLLQSKFLDERAVVTLVGCLQITKMRAPVGDHLQKSASRMHIFRIFLEMLGEFVNLFGKKRNLHIRRAGVGVVTGNRLNNRLLFLRGKHVGTSYHVLLAYATMSHNI